MMMRWCKLTVTQRIWPSRLFQQMATQFEDTPFHFTLATLTSETGPAEGFGRDQQVPGMKDVQ